MHAIAACAVVASHSTYQLLCGDLRQERRYHLHIDLTVVCHPDGADFQGFRIDGQMDLAPLPAIFRTIFLGFPFFFTQHLDASAIDQQMQRA